MSKTLRSLSDHQLLANTDAIVAQNRKLTLKLLDHLREIERRKLHLRCGHSSMFDYCTRQLRLSEPAAARRLRSARCLSRFPWLHELLESGEVNLSTISLVARTLTPENVDSVIARIRGKSQREVRAVVAEYEPRVMLPPDRVRPVVIAVPTVTNHCRSDGKKSSTASSLPDDAARPPGEPTPIEWKLEEHALVQFAARAEVIATLDKARSLASHRLRGGSLDELIRFLAQYFISREDPALRQKRRAQRREKADTLVSNASKRAIPSRLRDQVFIRDKHRCTYVGPNGVRCESTHLLQVDHIVPVARGGANTMDNLRLLCAKHNRLEAERIMGDGICQPRDNEVDRVAH